MSKFHFEQLDIAARLLDAIIFLAMPLLVALLLMLWALETAPIVVFFIDVATMAYYAIALIMMRNGTILSPNKDAILLGWLVSKIAKKEMEEFGKFPISPAFFKNIRNS